MDDDRDLTPEQAAFAEGQADWPLVRLDNACFYCQRLIGNPHKAGCVIVRSVFEVSFSLDLPGLEKGLLMQVHRPWAWNAHAVEFHLNDSSWCASNIAAEIEEGATRIFRGTDDVTSEFSPIIFAARTKQDEENTDCWCGIFEASFIRVVDSVPRTKTTNKHIQPTDAWVGARK